MKQSRRERTYHEQRIRLGKRMDVNQSTHCMTKDARRLGIVVAWEKWGKNGNRGTRKGHVEKGRALAGNQKGLCSMEPGTVGAGHRKKAGEVPLLTLECGEGRTSERRGHTEAGWKGGCIAWANEKLRFNKARDRIGSGRCSRWNTKKNKKSEKNHGRER